MKQSWKQVSSIGICLWFAVGCNTETKAPSMDGSWAKPGYGHWLNVGSDEITLYNSNDAGCVRQAQWRGADAKAFRQKLALSSKGELTGVDDGGVLGVWQRQPTLQARCRTPLNGSSDALLNFQFFWQDMQQYYAFFAERGVDWLAVRRSYEPLFNGATAEQQQQYYQQIFAQLRDAHLYLYQPDGTDVAQAVAAKGMMAQALLQSDAGSFEQALADVMATVKTTTDAYMDAPGIQALSSTDAIETATLAGNIGYVRINRLADLAPNASESTDLLQAMAALQQDVERSQRAMQEVKQRLGHTQGMIIDLRFNLGGSDAVALAIASHFNNQPRVIGSKGVKTVQPIHLAAQATPYQQPVRVLVGGATTSAAEVFTLALKALPQAQVLGEATQGSLSDVLVHQLPNGWQLHLSNEVYRDPSGALLEVKGVQPQQQVFGGLNLDQPLHSSTVLDAALQSLKVPAVRVPSRTEVQHAMTRLTQEFQLAGAAAAVLHRGQLVQSYAAGFADIATQRPMTADTPLQVASISKTLLGTAMAQLDIAATEPLGDLPFRIDHAASATALTFGQLARHQAGILDNDTTLMCGYYDLADGQPLAPQLLGQPCPAVSINHQAFLRRYLQRGGDLYQPQQFVSLGQTHYSNVATELLSVALEQRLGQSFASYSSTQIFAPLGLTHSYWPSETAHPAEATLYMASGTGDLVALPRYASSDYYAGSWHTSAHDLARYLAAIVSKTPATPLPQWTAARRDAALGTANEYRVGHDFPGYFWHRSGEFIGHTGGNAGVTTLMYYNIATETGLVLLLNADLQVHPSSTSARSDAFTLAQYQLAGLLYRSGLATP